MVKNSSSNAYKSLILLFYYLMLLQNNILVMSLCMELHFSGERCKCGFAAALSNKKAESYYSDCVAGVPEQDLRFKSFIDLEILLMTFSS